MYTDGGVEPEIGVGERVYLHSRNPEIDNELGTVVEIQPQENGANSARFVYVVDVESGGQAHVTRDVLLSLDDVVGKLDALVEDFDRWSDEAKRNARAAETDKKKERWWAREGTHHNAAKEIRERILGCEDEI